MPPPRRILVLALVSLVFGYPMVLIEDFHAIIIEEYFNFLSYVLMRNTIVVLVFPRTDMGVLHHGTFLDIHQLIRKLGY
jgi:hypothetical protein